MRPGEEEGRGQEEPYRSQKPQDAERPSNLLRQLRNVSDAERLRSSDQMNEPVDHQKDREEEFS